MTAAAPLTTTFQPSPSCLTDIYSTTTGLVNYLSLGPPEETTQCLPSNWKPTSQHFSPGICPSGYAVACSNINGAETQATCCPSSYSCQTSTDWPQYSTMACTAMVSDLPDPPVTAITSGTSVIPIGLNAGGGVNAFGVSIRWREGDFTVTAEETSRSKATSTQEDTSPQTNPNPNPNTPSPPSPPSPSEPPLSPGAKAGIAIGVIIPLLAILAILIIYLKRHRRRRKYGAGAGAHRVSSTADVSKELPAHDARANGQHELYGDGVGVNNGRGVVELGGGGVPVELDAGTGTGGRK